MSGGMHVHGPHDHALEHAAEHGSSDSFSGKVAVLTAVLATVGAMMGYMGGATQADAMLLKNESGAQKTAASNQWNFYQAKSQKQNLAELGAVLAADPAAASKFKASSARYETEKADIKTAAEALEAKSTDADKQSSHVMHLHHRWALATTLIQVSIALSAIALLTRRKWLLYGVGALGLGSLGVGILALLGL